jgi:two-component system phosphate regulon sensor histidine kinase PhoR
MSRRAALFAFCLAAGGIAGWLLHVALGAALGVAAGAALWFAADTWRAARVLRWLKAGGLRGVPPVAGWWGEAAVRARRALAAREERAADAERRLEAFLDAIRTSPNGVVLLDAQGRIEWSNQTAGSHFGLDARRDLQQHIVNLLRVPEFTAYYHAGRYESDLVIVAPDAPVASARKLSLHLHPYGEGRLLLLSRDVTAVEQAQALRRDFVANVSHEIRTPLTVLAGFVETLQNLELQPQERSRYLATMAQQAQRMQALVSDLLTLSRLEGSPLPDAGEWVPVAQLLAPREHEAQAIAQSLGKQLQLQFAPPPAVEVAGAAGDLASALSNLVSNAVRYTPAGGVVAVAAQLLADGRLALQVRDSGPGIGPDHLPRLAERFYRVDRSRSRDTGGTGLGLAIVKHVAQRHGGELSVDSKVGAGSTFSIVLPAARVRPAGDSVTPLQPQGGVGL